MMKHFQPEMSFDEKVAESYDDLSMRGDEAATIAFLAELGRGETVLELAIGTGRIALPLADQGVHVDGIDFSPAMVDRLRAKPGGEKISVVMGNFADVAVPGQYRLIYIVFNTLFNLLTQEEQVRCFKNTAAHLLKAGHFMVEGDVPSQWVSLPEQQYVHLEGVEVDRVRLDMARFDLVTQVLEETHVVLSSKGIELHPIVTRYAWPAELDLMARLAGLSLKERWGGWNRERFTGNSRNCISVYGW
jgi:SAM-dependent methyltransferase